MNKLQLCPCHSGKPYDHCCGPYHLGALAPSPVALMRSRYSAYALGKADYLIKTAAKPSPTHELKQFSRTTEFVGLEILEQSEEGDVGYVTFIASMKQGGKPVTMKEKSRFEKREGKWIYTSGEVEFLN